MLLVKNYGPPDFLSFPASSPSVAVDQSQPDKLRERHYTPQTDTFRQQKQQFTSPLLADWDTSLPLRQLEDLRMVTAGNADPYGALIPVDQSPAFPGEISSYQYHSMVLGHFPPDVKILLNNISPADRLSLYRKLLNDRTWSAKMFNKNSFLLYVDPRELKKLNDLLAGYAPQISPPAASDSSFGSPKRVLTIALRLQ